MILKWRERPHKDWKYPTQLLNDGYVIGGMRVTNDGSWEAVCFINNTIMGNIGTREEAEAWLIAVVRMSQ